MTNREETWSECLRITGKHIRQAREARNMTVEELFRKSNVSEDEYRRIEAGNDPNPDLRSIVAIAQTLRTPVDGLLPARWPSLGAEDQTPEA
ncbi:Helix-turn-helix domain-containing protein [Bifidobacterium bohemicum]|uniref:helix-turn-helix domain-containing protein n=1 Tax=Bifidobacterium bohemicum TaxID=638617 RepID=UPI000815E318|nr:helix-turn-helix transcriptional regulator [Bifidobacterium bohemicum]SCC17438.1 Helix-turn-helix domain-containing protein [Bifidobacterium bohemicum]